jgi:hypothetical protein
MAELVKYIDSTVPGKSTLRSRHEFVWSYFFDLVKIQRMRKNNNYQFGWSILTDGIGASVPFETQVPKMPKDKKDRPKSNLQTIGPGLYYEKNVLQDTKIPENKVEEFLSQYQFVPIDPGIRSPVTAILLQPQVSVSQQPGEEKMKRIELKKGAYRYQSGQVWKKQKIDARYKVSMRGVEQRLNTVPYAKTTLYNRLLEYVSVLGSCWNEIWEFWSTNSIQRIRLEQQSKQRSCLDKLIQKFERLDSEKKKKKKTVILFGNAANGGRFMKVKNAGFKGPVLKIRRLLAKKFIVLSVSECCTSKKCLDCTKDVCHPNQGSCFGVSFCSDRISRHRMLNRDLDAAEKIGYRFLSQLFRYDLGPFRWGSEEESWRHDGTQMIDFVNQYFIRQYAGHTRKN